MLWHEIIGINWEKAWIHFLRDVFAVVVIVVALLATLTRWRWKCNFFYVTVCNVLANGGWRWRRFSLEYFDLKRNEFSLVCVMNDSYSNYLNLSVISMASWFPQTLFQVGLCYYTCLTCFGAFSLLSFVSFSSWISHNASVSYTHLTLPTKRIV